MMEALLPARLPGVHGNAERLKRLWGGVMAYNHERDKWLLCDPATCVWKWDDTGAGAERYVAELMRELLSTAIAVGNEALRKEAIAALASGNRLRDVLCAAHQDMRVGIDDLDRDPDLLATRDGVLNLRTSELRAAEPDDFITKTVRCGYDPEASAPVFTGFLNQIFEGDEATISALRLYLGYSLTARVKSKAFFLCLGRPNTGKSTMVRAIYRMMGPYAAQIQIESLMRGSEHSATAQSDLCNLRGARFAITSEADAAHKLNVSRLKKIVEGGGTITAAKKYENTQEFAESHKLWVDSNARPYIPHDDLGVFDRMVPISFRRVFLKNEQDRTLDDKLDRDQPGILAWCAAGARAWYSAEGVLPMPPRVSATAAEYVSAMNVASRFIEDACETGPAKSVGASALYRAFMEWARNNRLPVWSQKKFSVELKSMGFETVHSRDGNLFSGIGLPC